VTKRTKIISGIASLAAIMIIYLVYQHMTYVETDNAQIEAHAVMLAAKVSGYVTKVNVIEGQKVKKGDVLVEIDERDFQNTLTQMKGDLVSLEARKRDAERNHKRISDLFRGGAVSQQQSDTASANYSDLQAKYDGIHAQVSQAELNLTNTKIKAPSDGFIAKRAVEEGQLAATGVPLLGFVDSGARWITANFKETDVEAIKIGAKVKITIDAISKKEFNGKVESISSATGATFTLLPPDNATGNFTKVVQRVPVRVSIDGLAESDIDLLRAGLSAVVMVRR
jgi:membrane fusion protein (multidrug efflux system)